MKSQGRPRHPSKSRFNLALECPTRLFYAGKAGVCPARKRENEFMRAVADGGFQVGELGELKFPGGIEITARSHDEQVAETERLLRRDDVTLFEAAIRHGNLFARVDVLRNTVSRVELIEVKAKSFDFMTDRGFPTSRGGIDSGMVPYLQDVAFQRLLLGLAYPHLHASSLLMLADKAKNCSVDGLNQRFKIRHVDGRPEVMLAPGTDVRNIGTPVLDCVNVDGLVDEILSQDKAPPPDAAALAAFIRSLTTRKVGKGHTDAGSRALVDLCHLAEEAFFHPTTKGSSSIKKVLPAVI